MHTTTAQRQPDQHVVPGWAVTVRRRRRQHRSAGLRHLRALPARARDARVEPAGQVPPREQRVSRCTRTASPYAATGSRPTATALPRSCRCSSRRRWTTSPTRSRSTTCWSTTCRVSMAAASPCPTDSSPTPRPSRSSTASSPTAPKILDHRGIVGADPIGALAHVQLGRAFVLSGDKIKAKAAYQDFFTLWKDADPDIPILRHAKAEYARVQ